MKSETAGGWAYLHKRRLFGLLVLNALRITGLNGLPIIQFNKPEVYWDGTETLAYSYRLNTSYHPRYNYQRDIAATGKDALVLVGENDEANNAAAYRGGVRQKRLGREDRDPPGPQSLRGVQQRRGVGRN